MNFKIKEIFSFYVFRIRASFSWKYVTEQCRNFISLHFIVEKVLFIRNFYINNWEFSIILSDRIIRTEKELNQEFFIVNFYYNFFITHFFSTFNYFFIIVNLEKLKKKSEILLISRIETKEFTLDSQINFRITLDFFFQNIIRYTEYIKFTRYHEIHAYRNLIVE